MDSTYPNALRCLSSLLLVLLSVPVAQAAQPPRNAAGQTVLVVEVGAAPVARYTGGVAGLASTRRAAGSPKLDARGVRARAYRRHVAQTHDTFETTLRSAIPSARVLHRYDMVVGGVAVLVPADRVADVAALPGVRSVRQDRTVRVLTNKSPAFIGAKRLWGKLGGPTRAGEGVVVGVFDTGIWPEHPSLSDPDAKGNAYPAPPGSYGCEFGAGPNPGPAFSCNNKLVGAYRFLDAFEQFVPTPSPSVFTSARDDNGHGTHVATTAVGNGSVKAEIQGQRFGKVSGIAPRAHLVAYRVCGFEGTCFGSDIVAAINQAVIDGVDVINFSVGGGSAPYDDPTSLAFLDAYESGIVVAAAGGNSGPDADTIEHLEPWVLTVGATTDKGGFGNKLKLTGSTGERLTVRTASITPGLKPAAPVVHAQDFGDEYCMDDTPDAAFAGQIVACRSYLWPWQSLNVAARGAVGILILRDPLETGIPSVPSLFLPGAILDADQSDALEAFLASSAPVTGQLTPGRPGPLPKDRVATFSSRAGGDNAVGVMKPDIAAPGVHVLAGTTPAPWSGDVVSGELFESMNGTSMATPHAAGAAALLRQAHPSWTAGQIRSALMTSASRKKLLEADGVEDADNFDVGAGRLDLRKTIDTGLTFDALAQDFRDHEDALWEVNLPGLLVPARGPDVVSVTRTAKSELEADSTWTVSVDAPSDLVITVPAEITVPAGGTHAFSIGVDKSLLGAADLRHGTITLASGRHSVVLPVSAIGTRPLPDLEIVSASMTSPITLGGLNSVAATLSNSGTAAAPGFWTLFYLSNDTTLSEDDALFANCALAGLSASATDSSCAFATPFAPQPSVPMGTYQLLVVTDAYGQVAESDETNNVLHAAAVVVN